jgi:hypothetical protein
MVAIKGNTYPVKDQLKALGGKWDAAGKAWMVPDEKAEQARALVPAATTYHGLGRNAALSGNRRNCPDVTKPCRKCGTYCYGDCEAN